MTFKPNTRASTQQDNNGNSPSSTGAKNNSRKPWAKPLKWEDHLEWVHRAIEYLTKNPTFQRKLFSDSTTDAKEENHQKVQAKEGKTILFSELVGAVFKSDVVSTNIRQEYEEDLH
ncbi:hypothetical protein ARMGADRAFT_1039166 [Armillaria gallica]|uniref:Uncharacterized protein n=2 Tax=Armillaria gallica TaxID=47427 RepID=A0A2H3CEY1_ARMGA|nr:hypothetical protein ARMGADRAFT_1039165 [Armillaria gallica]PBK81649.1 hypothetical protein ARMGADRAFT_1039166 [Armillaria gallica]